MSLTGRAAALVRAAVIGALLGSGCAAFAPAPAPSVVTGFAGQWSGWMTISRLGNGPASMTVRPDGRFDGALRLADGERPFHGALTALASGAVRYGGTFGDGAVTIAGRVDRRTMALVPDGGGGGATFARVQ